MNFKSIRAKLLLYFMLASVLPLLLVMSIEYQETDRALRQRSFDHLTSIRAIKKRKIEQYFQRAKKEIQYFSANKTVGQAMKDFRRAFFDLKVPNANRSAYKQQISQYYHDIFAKKLHPSILEQTNIDTLIPQNPKVAFLQSQYLIANKNAFESSEYHRIHEKYHAEFSGFLKKFGYYDIFLIDDSTGHIIYSVAKEIDFATSLLNGPYSNSNIGRVFRELRLSGNVDDYRIIDFEPYLPSYQYPAAFMACPITEGKKRLGTLIFQIPIDEINRVMTGNGQWREEGFGESGESYLIGPDYSMRNDSRFIIQSPNAFFKQVEELDLVDSNTFEAMKTHQTSILLMPVHTEAVEAAVNGIADTRVIEDYRGVEVLSSFTPLDIEGLKGWVLLSEIDASEAFSASEDIKWRFLGIMCVAVVCIFLLAIWIASSFSRPIKSLAKLAQKLSTGDYGVRIQNRENLRDEIGALMSSFNNMAENLQIQRAEIVEKTAELEAQNEEIYQNMEEMQTQRDSLEMAYKEISQQEEELRQNTEELSAVNDHLQATQEDLQKRLQREQKMREELEKARAEAEESQSSLLQAEKMASIGEMTASIAHEINNPINFVAGGIQSLSVVMDELLEVLGKYEEVHGLSPEEAQKLLMDIEKLREELQFDEVKEDATALVEDVKQGAKRVSSIVVGLRNISRMDDKELQLDDIHQNIDATLIIMREKYKDRVAIKKLYDESLPQLECYPGQLSQVFINLIGNAIEAIEGEGEVAIQTKNLSKEIEIVISDNGMGISNENQEKVFSSFFTTKAVGKGTGLGLSIVQKIIEKHKGKIQLESEEGKGTSFTITLPKELGLLETA